MITARCPICSKRFDAERIEDHPAFPFCSDRCRQIDLGRWIDGAYVLPGVPVPGDAPRGQTASPSDGDAE